MSALKSIPVHEPVSEAKPVERQASAADVARAVRRERARKLLRSVLLWVFVPTLLSGIYYFGVARDQYQSVATLFVNEREGHATGVMLREYLQSRDMLGKLEQRAHFSQHYAEHGEPIFGLSSSAGSETRYGEFRRVVGVRHDTASGVFTLTVRAYTPSAAHDFAQVLVEESQSFAQRVASNDADSPKLSEVARPSLPNESNYPHRAYGVLTAFLVSLALYVIGSLLIMAVREHAQF